MKSWQSHEAKVREIASLIWGVACVPEEIAGVKVDGVLKLKSDYWIVIEITERKDTLTKLREDLAKFNTVRPALMRDMIYAECYFITADEPPESIPKSAKSNNVTAISVHSFADRFFDFASYHSARQTRVFGSSFNPFNGRPDTLKYIPVSYVKDDDGEECDIARIIGYLKGGQKVIVVGDYGTGKSRCVREVYTELAEKHDVGEQIPLAIDLRKIWGLNSAEEIISRHLTDMGLSRLKDRALASFERGAFIFLLDGFDELGTQSWSDDRATLVQLRRDALRGVRDLIRRSGAGVLCTGRTNYFDSRSEMSDSLGVGQERTLLCCPDEFSEMQFQEFVESLMPGAAIPVWLPKRPLICQVLSEMDNEYRDVIFNDEHGDSVGFWRQFVDMITTRESWIQNEMTPYAVQAILRGLARYTRVLPGDFGPLSTADIFSQFRQLFHTEPTAASAQILYRLPGLGLIESGSEARQFADRFLLDGLRGDDVTIIVHAKDYDVTGEEWVNPLRGMGQMIVFQYALDNGAKVVLSMARRAANNKNSTLALDLVGALLRYSERESTGFDFEGLSVSGGRMGVCDLGFQDIAGLSIHDAHIDFLMLDNRLNTNVALSECTIAGVMGVSSAQGMPEWCKDCLVDWFQSISTTNSIRKSHLSVQHQMLCTIIRKTFFQKGAGRKEEALLRGLGQIDRRGYRKKILRVLVSAKVLEKDKGHEGNVYRPVRSHTGRMNKMMAELNHSDDPIWKSVGELMP